jgi:hypothetical protein
MHGPSCWNAVPGGQIHPGNWSVIFLFGYIVLLRIDWVWSSSVLAEPEVHVTSPPLFPPPHHHPDPRTTDHHTVPALIAPTHHS